MPARASQSKPTKRTVPFFCVAIALVVLLGAAFGLVQFLQARTPRARAARVVDDLGGALLRKDGPALIKLMKLPVAMQTKSALEIERQVLEFLTDEVSDAGWDALKRRGQFGPLRQIFPEEADRWAAIFAVAVDECLAFRMERDGVRAEVVLQQSPSGLRVLRCNNVKQMAPPASQS